MYYASYKFPVFFIPSPDNSNSFKVCYDSEKQMEDPYGETSNLKSVMERKNCSALYVLSRLLYFRLISSLTSVLQRYSVLTLPRKCLFKELTVITIKSIKCFSLHVRCRHVLSVLTIHIKSQEVEKPRQAY